MIVVCEPQCRAYSHESVNGGFLYGLRLAYPEDRIVFFADPTHVAAIQNIHKRAGVVVDNIEYIPIAGRAPTSVAGMARSYAALRRMLSQVRTMDEDKMFFLSYSAAILYLIKRLKTRRRFADMKFTFVLHGSFEQIADLADIPVPMRLPITKFASRSLRKKLAGTSLANLPRKVLGTLRERLVAPSTRLFNRVFQEKKMLLWKHTPDYRYVALSPHMLANAARYVDVTALNITPVILPTIFTAPAPFPENEHITFATFGYGNALMLHNVVAQLSQRQLSEEYEIRVIGMDSRGTEGFPHVTCPSPGRWLDRSDMDRYAHDVDMFLILYDRDRYRLSCSGSILEALSYAKPILHFENDCINMFNTRDTPIGIRCDSIEDMVGKMADLIQNYAARRGEMRTYRDNMLTVRDQYTIQNSLAALRSSFTWPR
jgi:hypothetical protein